MINIGFGKVIEKLMYFSGEKNYSLSRVLGYDVSYLSKWINGSMLPTSKNIKIICERIADFIIEHTNQSSQMEIASYFNIDLERYNSEELLKEYIKNMTYESYLLSKKNRDDKMKKTNSSETIMRNNSILISNPRSMKKYLDDSIMNFIKKQKATDIIVLSDLFSLGRDDKLQMAGIKNGMAMKTNMENVNLKFLISFHKDIEDIIFNIILFLNMIMVHSNINLNFYSCNHSKYSQIVAVKGKSFSHAVYTDNKNCLFINTTEDSVVVHDMYKLLEEMIEKRSEPTFFEKNTKEMILGRKYVQYIMGKDLEWLIGDMNELLMPSDLFMELGRNIFSEEEEVIKVLENINAILQNVTHKSNIHILMYESTIKEFISTGKMKFFNIRVELGLEQIQKYIEYIEKLIRKNKSIELKLIIDNLIDDFKYMENQSIFLSRKLNYIKVNSSEGISNKNKYLIIRDERVERLFLEFFDEVWNIENENLILNREESISRLEDLINYIKILKFNKE